MLSRARFEDVLRVALDDLPPRFRDALVNVAVVVREWPPDDLLDDLGIPEDDTLYGYYGGIPLPERTTSDPLAVPDIIEIYRGPLCEDFPDQGELRDEIRITLLHEIGHYFGMTEDDLDAAGYR